MAAVRCAIVLGVAFLLFGSTVQAQTTKSCPSWRPCGGGETWGGNRFIPQFRAGADFRPVCAAHDKCYGAGTTSTRKECDDAFLRGLQCACESSTRPRACKRRAKFMYIAVRRFGGDHFGEAD